MKKKLFIPLALFAVVVFCASCDSKLCYCYQTSPNGVYEEEVYTNTDTPCNALSTNARGCVESNERMNPHDIAYK